ncbi:MAG: class I SAM-dependent methyltransferase [Pseudomonadales bacterium]|nr:class I SAM-dependent methyltransferase [Pseudomonadales bacterium]
MNFNDHFSGHAGVYAAARPDYPHELFEYLNGICSKHEIAFDCAAGNGQATRGLLPFFSVVLMSDGSSKQIEQAKALCEKSASLHASVMLAENLGLKSATLDLVTVAQALHWFNLDNFFTEVDRVLRTDGVFACWSYGIHSINQSCDRVVYRLYEDIVGEYWPPQRRLVENHYAGIDFPLTEVTVPDFKLEKQWSIEQVLGYLRSWSAVQRYAKDRQQDPVAIIEPDLRLAFGEEKVRTISWPLNLIVRKKA